MASGLFVEIPNLGKVIMPFTPFDNNEFFQTLEKRMEQATKVHTKIFEEAIKQDQNFHIINAVVSEFLKLLKLEFDPTRCLYFAGDISQLVRRAKKVEHKEYKDNLTRLYRALKKIRPNFTEAGMDQIIARLKFLMEFEDPIRIWQYYALWAEDYMVPEPI